MNALLRSVFVCVALLFAETALGVDTPTKFSYQGRLKLAGAPVTGSYDIRVSLWTEVSGGSMVAGPQTFLEVAVDKGLFVVIPDFDPDVWNGDLRYIQLEVRASPQAGNPPYTTLAPRQLVTPAPYALFAQKGGYWTFDNGALFFDGNAPVAIGTTAPAAQLHVVRDAPDNENVLTVQFAGGDVGSTTYDSAITRIVSNSGFRPLLSLEGISGPRAIFSSSGYLGLGTTAPQFPIDIVGSTADLRINLHNNGDLGRAYQLISSGPGSGVGAGWFRIYDASPSSGGDRLLINPAGWVGIGNVIPTSQLHVKGNVLISAGAPGNGNGDLSVNGAVAWNGNMVAGGLAGFGANVSPSYRINCNGAAFKTDGPNWSFPSDRRAKTAIRSIEEPLETLRRIRPVEFHFEPWYRDAYLKGKDAAQFNIIAQEFAEVFPDFVTESPLKTPEGETLLGADTSPLLPYAVAAIKELDAKNSALEATVAQQVEEIAALKERLARIEAALLKSSDR